VRTGENPSIKKAPDSLSDRSASDLFSPDLYKLFLVALLFALLVHLLVALLVIFNALQMHRKPFYKRTYNLPLIRMLAI
jgi:succinate dehydrogenase/fumarate reductase cytochrome b subunit